MNLHKHFIRNGFLFYSFAIILQSCTPSFNSSKLETTDKKIRVIALSDFHGALEPRETKTKDGKIVKTGGAALLASYIEQIRAESPYPVVLLDGGDMFQGTLVSNTAEGEPVIKFYNELAVDAAAVGNHEFDYGPTGSLTIPKKPSDDPRGALKERAKQAEFPFLAANIKYKNGETPEWTQPSIMIERGGIKIGIVGATTESTPSTTNAKNLVGLDVLAPAKPIIEEAKKLRMSGAQFVLLTIHAGSGCSNNSVDKQLDLSSCDLKGEIFKILEQAPKNLINAVVSGHTHQGVAKNFNNTAVLQSYSHGQSVLFADLSLKGEKPIISEITSVCGSWVKNGEQWSCNRDAITKYEGELVDPLFLGKNIYENPKITALLEPDFSRVAEIKKTPVGINVLNYFERSYYDESSLGNLVVDLMRSFVLTFGFESETTEHSLSVESPLNLSQSSATTINIKEETPKAILGMTNNGGLRANIDAGALSYGQVFDVLPFDNQLALLKVSGEIVLKLMEFGIDRKHGGMSWSGASLEAESCKVTMAKSGEESIDPKALYWVVTNDYMATGGSGVDELKLTDEQVVILDDAPFLRDAVVEVLKHEKKDLDPSLYFKKDSPRVNVKKICETQ